MPKRLVKHIEKVCIICTNKNVEFYQISVTSYQQSLLHSQTLNRVTSLCFSASRRYLNPGSGSMPADQANEK